MKLIKYFIWVFVVCFCLSSYGWEAHGFLTYLSLRHMPEITQKQAVPAETLEHFLQTERYGLVKLLSENEIWSRENIATYPSLPQSLAFDAKREDKDLTKRFLQSIRINPTLSFPIYAGHTSSESKDVLLPKSAFMLAEVYTSFSIRPFYQSYRKLTNGEKITPLEILILAADEPDFGLDDGLWEDSHTWFGKIYEWGKQPFGNPKASISAQAPFHMGFFYEPAYFYWLASDFKRCYPEYRIHLFSALSKYAFETGHPYWGYRFLGWALHYIQDLTQPYHSTPTPGQNFEYLFAVELLNKMHFPSYKQNLIQIVTNRHYALENYVSFTVENAAKTEGKLKVFNDTQHDAVYPPYSNSYARQVVGAESHARAVGVDHAIVQAFDPLYTSDPNYYFYTTQPDINLFAMYQSHTSVKDLDEKLVEIFMSIGSHTRNFIRASILTPPHA